MNKIQDTKIILWFMLFFSIAGNLFSADLVELGISAEIVSELWANQSITRFPRQHEELSLLPNVEGAQPLTEDFQNTNFAYATETLQYIPTPNTDYTEEDNLVAVYNTLRSISTLEGLEYYSVSRGRMHTLFSQAYTINSPDAQEEIPDRHVAVIPQESTVYAMQDDSRFGPNIYRLEYTVFPDSILLSSKNLTGLYYTFVRVIAPEDLSLQVLVIPTEDALVFYGLSYAPGVRLPFLSDRIQSSIENRLEAFARWFRNSIENTD
ncbi:MAG: DUF6675 family protein [Spirochaetia bacterium]